MKRELLLILGFIFVAILAAVLTYQYFLTATRNDPSTDTAALRNIPAQSGLPFDAAGERRRWKQRIHDAGAAGAYENFKAEFQGFDFGMQHIAAHLFGELLYENKGIGNIAVCDSAFSFGCYHSFFGRAISERGTGALPDLYRACVEKFGPLGTGCQHGLGHGLLEYLGHDRLEETLAACGDSAPQVSPFLGCTSGVFMEYNLPIIISAVSATPSRRSFDEKNPYAPCPSIPEKFRLSCYYETPAWWQQEISFDTMGVLCSKVRGQAEREACFKGIGSTAAPSNQYDVSVTIDTCKRMPGVEGQLFCRAGASWGFYVLPEKRSQADQLCGGLPEKDRLRCVKEARLF
ncbi:MAG: hypothetical protein HY006_02405 [Candidatus Sungbacteria bacterium]|nr:hypothetical protein [Candidatus Sungbacteria bacterium]